MTMNLEGKLLVSHPNHPKESMFYKSVIYLYQDREELGSIGVMLNKPSKFTLEDLCTDKNIVFQNKQYPIYHGGPVNQNALVMLHTAEWRSANTAEACNNLYISSDNQMLTRLALKDEPLKWRLFGGLCGWAPGQLVAEMQGIYPFSAEHSWLIADVEDDFIFRCTGNKQYQQALELSGQQLFNQYF